MIIGVTGSTSKTQYFLNQAYIDYVQDAGHEAVILHPRISSEVALSVCDALLLSGGTDLDPMYYMENNARSISVDIVRDNTERDLLRSFTEAGRPVFAICRGFQLICRELSLIYPDFDEGTVFSQHILGHALTNELDLKRDVPSHFVEARLNLLYPSLGEDDGGENIGVVPVNSIHHQGLMLYDIKNLEFADGDVKITAWTTVGVNQAVRKKYEAVIVEGIKARIQNSTVMAVQWHPEALRDTKLLVDYINTYRERELNTTDRRRDF